MPATNTKTERQPALFDAAGNHLHVHGNTVRSSGANVLRDLGVAPGLMVMTRAEPRKKKHPRWCCTWTTSPLTLIFAWHLRPPVRWPPTC